MLTGLFYAHSGLRFLVLLLGVVCVIYYALAWRSKRPAGRGDTVLFSVFAGVLGLQGLLGIGMMAGGVFYPALIGHLVVMLALIVGVSIASARSRKTRDSQKAHVIRLIASVAALVLIAVGISALGRGIFQSNAPTLEVITGD